LANEQAGDVVAEGISKEGVAYLFLQKERSDDKATFSNKNVEQQLESAKSNFKVIEKMEDDETDKTHFRTVEMYDGVPVYGSEQTVAVDADNHVSNYFGDVTAELNRSTLSTDPSLNEDEALGIVKNDIEGNIGEVEYYDKIDSKLILYPENDDYTLAYYVKASTTHPVPGYFHYFVDASNGDIINDLDALHKPSADFDESRADSFPAADEDDPEIPGVPEMP